MNRPLDGPQNTEGRHRWCGVTTRHGRFQALRPPLDITGSEPAMGRVPSLGQHTTSVLDWLRRESATHH